MGVLDDLGNKTFKATGTIYSTGSGGTPDVHGTPAAWKKADEEVSVASKFSAVIESKDDRYILLEYTLTDAEDAEPQNEIYSEPTTKNCVSPEIETKELKDSWAKALAAPEKVTKLKLVCAEGSDESSEEPGVTISLETSTKHLPSTLGLFTDLKVVESSRTWQGRRVFLKEGTPVEFCSEGHKQRESEHAEDREGDASESIEEERCTE